MNPLSIFRKGFITLLFLYIITPHNIEAQVIDEDLQKMSKDADTFCLKFGKPTGISLAEMKYNKIALLLEKYKNLIPPDIQSPFRVQGDAANQKPYLTDGQQKILKDITQRFFLEMSNESNKLTLRDLQQFAEDFKKKNPRTGDNPTKPTIAWMENFQTIERTLMGGRTYMIMDVWNRTLVDFFNAHPEAAGIVYGQMDIGSWVKMSVNGLEFAADIDFSTLSIDKSMNKLLQTTFNDNLKSNTGLNMIQIDVVLTPHGQAGAEVFIGEWGKAFAEVDMLKRGKWKLLKLVKNKNGYVEKIEIEERSGKELFFEKSVEMESRTEDNSKSIASKQKQNFNPVLEYPELNIKMEPMLSLEMLRHAIHDIEHGPFEGGQKIIKMIKYTERSFFMIDQVGSNMNYKDAYEYFNLSAEEQQLKSLCEQVIQNKSKPAVITTLLENYYGKPLPEARDVAALAEDMTSKCKRAMLKNASQAFGFRAAKISEIKDEEQRFKDANEFLDQMNKELNEGFRNTGVEIPASIERTRKILFDLRAGKLNAEETKVKLEEVNKIMEQEYHLDKTYVERFVANAWTPLMKYFTDNGYKFETAQKLIEKFKWVYTTDWRRYWPDLDVKTAVSEFVFSKSTQSQINDFHTHLAKTKVGKIMNNDMFDKLDNLVALYDAYLSGKTEGERYLNVAWTGATIWAQGKEPFLALPLGMFNSLKSKNIMPAAMAILLYVSPSYVGQVYMITNLIDRIPLTAIRDYDFRNHLDRLAVMAETDGQGHVVRFKVPKAFSGLSGSKDSIETDPDIPLEEPGRTQGIKTVFYDPAFMYCPDIKYFNEIVPRNVDRFGEFDTKIQQLKKLFAFDDEFIGILELLEKIKKEKNDGIFPELFYDVFYGEEAIKRLDSMSIAIENQLWRSVFRAIESTKQAEKQGVVAALEVAIQKIEDELFLDDLRMKEIGKTALLIRIRNEIQNDPLYKKALTEDYTAGLAYDRVAYPVFEKYINTYNQILDIKKRILEIWSPFGLIASDIQKKPMRLLLMGANSGAPMLTTDYKNDLKISLECFDAHKKKAKQIREDLENALGRTIKDDDKKDKEYLKELGKIGFGFESLIDASPSYRSPLFKDVKNEIVPAMTLYRDKYKELLENIKNNSGLSDLNIKIKGENETEENKPATAELIFENKQGKLVSQPQGTLIEWYRFDATTGKELKVGTGTKFTNDGKTKGQFDYTAKLLRKMNNQTIELGKTSWNLYVKAPDAKDPTTGIKLKIPDVIRQYDIIEVSAEIPASLKGRISNCSWGGYEMIRDANICNAAKLQFADRRVKYDKNGNESTDDELTIEYYFNVMMPGETVAFERDIEKLVKFQNLNVNVNVSDQWEGSSGPADFRVEKKREENSPRIPSWSADKKPVSTASVGGRVTMQKADLMETMNTDQDLKAYVSGMANNITDSNKPELREITIDGFKGYGLYNAPVYTPGGRSDAGYIPAQAISSFNGYIMKGARIFNVFWVAGASGAFDNTDKEWMMNKVRNLSEEAAGILAGVTFKPDGKLNKGTVVTATKPVVTTSLQIMIEPKPVTLKLGEKITVNAIVKNAKPEFAPYTYKWSGHIEGDMTRANAQLMSDRPGKNTVIVSVEGKNSSGTATLEYTVEPLKIKLVKNSPLTDTVNVGAPVELAAEITGILPAGKKINYLWQPYTEEKFDPYTGKNSTSLIFTSPGHKKVWVQVMDETTADHFILGESEQMEFEVNKPPFIITFTPAKTVVGAPVIAKITSAQGKLEDVSYRWMPLPENAKLINESQDASEITFYAKDALHIELEVIAIVKATGEELGTVKGYYVAERYNIKAEGPKIGGPKPMEWKQGKGLIESGREISIHQIVEFSAWVTPQPPSNITYEWKLLQGNATINNPIVRDARVTALEPGLIQLQVTVKDNNGVVLGSTTAAFNASSSGGYVDPVKQKEIFDKKLNEARQKMYEGKLDEAVTLGLELKTLNAKDASTFLNELGDRCKKAAADAANKKDFDLAIKRTEQALQLNSEDSTAKNQLELYKKLAAENKNAKNVTENSPTIPATPKKLKADELWSEAARLTQDNKTKKEGLLKMKESFDYWNSSERIEYARKIEKEINGKISNIDISGEWRHGVAETFTFTPTGEGKYNAVEKGFGYASGTVSMIGNNAYIDYKTRDGFTTGQYILKLNMDGNSGIGKWTDNRNATGDRNFIRVSTPKVDTIVSVPETKAPAPSKPTEKKKKKNIFDLINDMDSILTGKKPVIVGTEPADPNKEEILYSNNNIGAVSSGPTNSTTFTISKTINITRIENYHYFSNGKQPGTISLQSSSGKLYGPWQASGINGQGGVQNAYWVVMPNIELPAGIYTVIDSDPTTWSHNNESNNCGITTVFVKKGIK